MDGAAAADGAARPAGLACRALSPGALRLVQAVSPTLARIAGPVAALVAATHLDSRPAAAQPANVITLPTADRLRVTKVSHLNTCDGDFGIYTVDQQNPITVLFGHYGSVSNGTVAAVPYDGQTYTFHINPIYSGVCGNQTPPPPFKTSDAFVASAGDGQQQYRAQITTGRARALARHRLGQRHQRVDPLGQHQSRARQHLHRQLRLQPHRPGDPRSGSQYGF